MSKFKRLLTGLVIAAMPYSVLAAPAVTFEGEVTDQTCSVNISGQTNSVVLLPVVKRSDFGNFANGATAGETPFTVSLTGCTAPSSADQRINTRFLGYDVDASTGVLTNRNTSANAAKGYGIQLMDAGSGGNPIILNGITDVAGLVLPQGETSTSYDFSARYYVINATAAQAGRITSVAEYTLNYL
ncbi:fimbrial protein [Pantoea sp.]|uniref:fimbrial protein n=1 Tax=Pantoea sp. TaxID=69393 RepID=UPI00289A9531|nr:fimbrial protein [Pantoea sp.]